MVRDYRKFFSLICVVIVPLGLAQLFEIQRPEVVALFASIVFLWLSELAPLAVTALLVPVLAVIYGILPASKAFSPFGDQILFLFVGVFFLAAALQKHSLDQRISYYILSSRYSSTSVEKLLIVLALICWFLSMWISNTATCAIAMPIGLGIANTLGREVEDLATIRRLKYRILFICAFAASVGGICTPVGSPPNLIAISFLEKAGIKVSFIEWMIIGLPASLTMLVALLLILKARYPLPSINLKPLQSHFKKELEDLGSISKHEVHVILCFLLAITLWITPSLLSSAFSTLEQAKSIASALPMGVAALLAAIPLFVLKSRNEETLNWADATKIDWGTILLFGGGLCLGHILIETGLASDIGKDVLNLSGNNLLLLGACAIVLAIISSEISSNTAASSIIIPILIGSASLTDSAQIKSLCFAAAYGASFGFMLPVSTPPNAIVYGTGELPLREMIKTGYIFDIVGSLIIFIFVILLGSL